MQYQESEKRFIAILNRGVPAERLLNALGHLTAGLVGAVIPPADAEFLTYTDSAGREARLSTYAYVLLGAKNSGQLKRCRDELISAGLPANWFAKQMLGSSAADQMQQTREASEAELELWAVVTFGAQADLAPITKRFSLFRSGGGPEEQSTGAGDPAT